MFALLNLGGGEIMLILALCLVVPLGLACMAFWIWMLVDCVRNQGLDQTERVVWAVVIAITHFIGAAIYFFAARSKGRLAMPPRTA